MYDDVYVLEQLTVSIVLGNEAWSLQSLKLPKARDKLFYLYPETAKGIEQSTFPISPI